MTTAFVAVPVAAPPRPLFTASVYAWAVLLLCLHAVVCVVALPWTLLFDRDRRFAAGLGAWLTRTALHAPVSFRGAAAGLSSIRPGRPVVIVMNHRSLADIAVAVAVPGGPKIVSKPWVGQVPLVGLGMRLCGHLIFDPASLRSTRDLMTRVEGHLARGNSVLFFPEGTRQTSPGLGRFADCAFLVAVRAQVDVLPVVLHGMGDLVPKGSFTFHDAAVGVTPLAPIAPGTDRRELSRRVRSAIAAELVKRV